jgi:hypothetical protein
VNAGHSNTASEAKDMMSAPTPVTSALAWTTLGMRWMEMMVASGYVIGRRTRRKPSPAQLLRMGSEKAEAALASGNAMARQMTSLPFHDPMAMWGAWARVLGSGVAPYRARAVRNARVRRRG